MCPLRVVLRCRIALPHTGPQRKSDVEVGTKPRSACRCRCGPRALGDRDVGDENQLIQVGKRLFGLRLIKSSGSVGGGRSAPLICSDAAALCLTHVSVCHFPFPQTS